VEGLARAAGALPWPVWLAGEGAPPPAPNVTVLGRLSRLELDVLLARASVYALPARYEPFGFGPLEAGLAGCALVLGDVRSLREVWDEAALFVDPDDTEALVAALRLLCDEPELRTEFAARAREQARSYTPEQMAKGYLAAYAEVLPKRAVAAA
jgi:glycosyltransferase involved in cell wall biosynthesis